MAASPVLSEDDTRRAGVASLSLRSFRNFEQLELEVPPPGLVVVGDNGQGKTNLLEAVQYLGLMRSVRGARDSDVTRFGSSGFFMEASIRSPEAHSVAVGFERAGRRKRVRVDGAVVERLSDALGALPAVTFSPGDVQIVAGTAAARRRFLDVLLALSSRGYLLALQQYRAALERRNAVLRAMGGPGGARRRGLPARADEIAVWERPLAEHGAWLARARRAWIAGVAARFAERCESLGEQGRAVMRYVTNVDVNAASPELALSDALAAQRASDVRLGATQIGPHRDDVALLLDGRELRAFGSAGQQRTAAIALRTLEAETIRDARAVAPVFLLDDPFAELDERRAARVLGLLASIGVGQTILTVPRESDIPPGLSDLPRRRISGGAITA